jgi:hypothetical protein
MAAVAITSGCFSDQAIRQNAAFDFGCKESDITVVPVGNGYGATGCGKKATYVWLNGTGWVKNSETTSAKSQ